MTTGALLAPEINHYPPKTLSNNPALTGKIPNGYVTSDEFWNKMDNKLKVLCKEHGLL